jgi:hypothetical protein
MSERHWSHILHFSLNQEKQDSPVSQTGVSGFACNGYISNSGSSSSKTECSNFYWLVFGDGIKASPFPPLRVAGFTNKNTHPKAFVSSSLHLLVMFV